MRTGKAYEERSARTVRGVFGEGESTLLFIIVVVESIMHIYFYMGYFKELFLPNVISCSNKG